MNFGKQLKELRKNQGMSQTDFAKVLGVTQATIANYEKNARQPNLEQLIQISEFFDVSVDYLMGLPGRHTAMFDPTLDHIQNADLFLDLILSENMEAIHKFITKYLDIYTFDDLLFQLFRYSLTKLGWLWEVEEITISEEHRVSNLLEEILDGLDFEIETSKNKRIIGMTVPGEKHTMGLKMLMTALKYRGYKTHYIGEGVPLEDFIKYTGKLQPDVIILSITSPYFKEKAEMYLDKINAKEIYLVGMGTSGLLIEGVDVLRDYRTCLEVIK
jgi:transcriptional regulator with XRE-family HTH domain